MPGLGEFATERTGRGVVFGRRLAVPEARTDARSARRLRRRSGLEMEVGLDEDALPDQRQHRGYNDGKPASGAA